MNRNEDLKNWRRFIPERHVTTSLCWQLLCTMRPSFKDITLKLLSQWPQVSKKNEDRTWRVPKQLGVTATSSPKGPPSLRLTEISGPTLKNRSCTCKILPIQNIGKPESLQSTFQRGSKAKTRQQRNQGLDMLPEKTKMWSFLRCSVLRVSSKGGQSSQDCHW